MDAQVSVMGSMLIEAQEVAEEITGGWVFPVLEVLEVVLRCEAPANLTVNGPEQQEQHLHHIMHFINRLSSLKSLSLKTIGHTDLSFLGHLGKIPLLTKLSLIMPLDKKHLNQPEAVKRVLHHHPRVRELCVRYTRCCWDPDEDGFVVPGGGTGAGSRVSTSLKVKNPNSMSASQMQMKPPRSRSASVNLNVCGAPTTHESGSGAHHLIYTNISLPTLYTLHLGLHLPLPSSLPTLSALTLLPNAHTLTTLILKDRSLSLSEARSLLLLHRGVGVGKLHGIGGGALHGCRNLRRLSMFARKLSPQLVDLVASACPVLSVWDVDVGVAVGWDSDWEEEREGSEVEVKVRRGR